ncbi:hypothetical protein EF405_12465 [Cyclobacteriaceae bacterium YHN15]|jgi:hypothetical protein|nr:hypothetical protein EF405_12465 [Cyclobacteriaceae bacterium YHN15]
MNFILKTFLISVTLLGLSYQVTIAQASTPPVTGVFSLSNGNELRLVQAPTGFFTAGNMINSKRKILAQFEGNYDAASRKLEGNLIHCSGKEEELLWYFSRNTDDRAEVYLGPAGNDTKAVASRIQANPNLEFPCKISRRKVKKILKRDSKYRSETGS